MTELEKIAYAKSFIDKLANGINPLDDTPIPDGEIVNNVRLSRCFFYVSSLLERDIERERRSKPREGKDARLPFAITQEQLKAFEASSYPVSATTLAKKINSLVQEDIEQGKMERLSYRKIVLWLLHLGMIEYREWGGEKMKRFPTAEGEAVGLVSTVWNSYGRKVPVIFFNEEAQRFVVDNIDAVIATETKKGKTSYPFGVNEGEDEEE